MAVTEIQKLWAKAYVKHNFNATKAAVECGYAVASASRRGYEMSHNTLVLSEVARLVAGRNKRLKVDADYVLRRIVEIDTLDLLDILDERGCILPIREWPKSWRISISGVDFGKLIRANDDPDKMMQLIDNIKWPDKARNLELLGKHIDVKAWDKDAHQGTGDAQPLQITFEVAAAKSGVQVTNAKP